MMKEQEAETPLPKYAANMGLAAPAFPNTKPNLVGNSVASDARELKALEEENSKLKKLLAETMLDNTILKVVAVKKC